MKIARLGTAFIFAIGSYGLSALRVEAAPVPASEQGQGALADVVPAPHWRPGSTWEYSDGYSMRVSDVKDGVTIFDRLDAPGHWFSMRGFLRQDAASAGAERKTIYRTVAPGFGDSLSTTNPLTFRREYLSNGELIVHGSSWSVEGRERITVPAGTFDTWVIVWRERSLKSNWTGFERWWYSPEAQQYVRMEYKYGTMEPASRVLMRYRLAPAIAIGVRPSPLPAALERIPDPIKPVPVDAMKLDPVIVPRARDIPAPEIPAPILPAKTPDPIFVPLSRKEPDAPPPPALKQIPVSFTRMSPVFIAPMQEVAIDETPAPLLVAVAMITPIVASLDALEMSEVEMEAEEAQVRPLEIEMPTIAMPTIAMEIETPPMADVAFDLPENADVPDAKGAELAMLWPSDRIDNLRRRVMPYYDPEPFMPAPAAITPEPAVGTDQPFGLLGRIFRAIVRIFD